MTFCCCRCCYYHDLCWGNIHSRMPECTGLSSPYTVFYEWKCHDDGSVTCHDAKNTCHYETCMCDAIAAECFRTADFNIENYDLDPDKHCSESSFIAAAAQNSFIKAAFYTFHSYSDTTLELPSSTLDPALEETLSSAHPMTSSKHVTLFSAATTMLLTVLLNSRSRICYALV